MCIRRYVLYQCGHEGRQLGYSYCRFQEALDRLSDQEIAENHPIIQQHQNSCRTISGRRGERRNRDCGQCSRAPKSSTEAEGVRARSPANEEAAVDADDEDTSCPFPENEDSEGELSSLSQFGEGGQKTKVVELNEKGPSPPPPEDGNSEEETAYLSLSGNEASEEETDNLSHSGTEDSADETDNLSLTGPEEQRANTPSNDGFLKSRTATNRTPQPLCLPSIHTKLIGLTHKSSGSYCSTCSEAGRNNRPCSPGSEVWNEDYQGERATTAVFERPGGEGFRVVDVVAAAAAVALGAGGDNRLGEKEREKCEEEDEHVQDVEGAEKEMAGMSLEAQGEDVFEKSEGMPIVVPRLRRKRKNLALRDST